MEFGIKGFQITVASREVETMVGVKTEKTFEMIQSIHAEKHNHNLESLASIATKELKAGAHLKLNIINDDESIHPYQEIPVGEDQYWIKHVTSRGVVDSMEFDIKGNWKKQIETHINNCMVAYADVVRDSERRIAGV